MFRTRSNVWEKVGPLSLIAGLSLWLIFLLSTRVTYSEIGLIDTVGVLFYVSVGLITLAIIVQILTGKIGFLCYLSVISLFAAMYSLPWLIEGTPYFSAIFRVLGYTNFIVDHNFYNPAAMSYQNWPGVMLVGMFIKSAFNCQAIDILYIYPIVAKVLQLAVVYLIIERMTKDRAGAIVGVTLFILFDWTPYYMFLPPSMGFLLFVAVMLVLCVRHVDTTRRGGWIMLFILFVASCIISHLLTAILILGILLALYLLENSPIKLFRVSSKGTITFGLLVLSTVMMFSYTLYANTKYFQLALPGFINSIGNLIRVFGSASNVGSGSSAYSEVVLYKYVFTAIIGIVLLVAFIYILRKSKGMRQFHNFFPFLVMFISVVIPVTIFSFYNFEAITRSFAYVIPFVALFLVYSRKRRAVAILIVVLMLISPALFVASAYGNMNKDFISRDEIIGTTFYYDHTDQQKSFAYGFNERLLLMDMINEWRYRNIEILDGVGNWENNSYPSYVVFSDRAIEAGLYFGVNADINTTYNILYGNHGARVYDSPTYRLFWTGPWNTTVVT